MDSTARDRDSKEEKQISPPHFDAAAAPPKEKTSPGDQSVDESRPPPFPLESSIVAGHSPAPLAHEQGLEEEASSHENMTDDATETNDSPAGVAGKEDDGGAMGGTISRTTTSEDYISGFKLWMVLIAICLVVFTMLLDISVVTTAIPKITTDFHSLDDVGWYGSAYLLANCALQPLAGKLYAKFRSKWIFMGFFFVFEVGSLLCGVATSSKMLIVGRAVAGMGGAGLQNGALTIISCSVPLHKRPLYIGGIIGVGQMGAIIGPLIGGALTEYTTWRWCFYINLPIGGLVAIFLLFVYIPDTVKTITTETVLHTILYKLDLIGFVLFAPSTIQLLLALDYGGNAYAWNSSIVIGLFVGAGATFIVFMIWEKYQGEEAMLPLSMLKRTVVWSSCLVQVFFFAMAQTVTYYLPIYFQAIKAASPTLSGVYMLPSILGQLTAAIGGGRAVTKIGYVLPFALVGASLASIGHGLLTTFTPTTPTGQWIGYQILVGVGRGFGAQMAFVSVQNSLPPKLVAVSTSLLTFSQTLGGAVFLTLANVIFSTSLKNDLTTDASGVSPGSVINAGATGLRDLGLDAEQLAGVLVAYAGSVDKVFYLALGCSLACFGASWGMGFKDIRKKDKGKGKKEKKVADDVEAQQNGGNDGVESAAAKVGKEERR